MYAQTALSWFFLVTLHMQSKQFFTNKLQFVEAKYIEPPFIKDRWI